MCTTHKIFCCCKRNIFTYLTQKFIEPRLKGIIHNAMRVESTLECASMLGISDHDVQCCMKFPPEEADDDDDDEALALKRQPIV